MSGAAFGTGLSHLNYEFSSHVVNGICFSVSRSVFMLYLCLNKCLSKLQVLSKMKGMHVLMCAPRFRKHDAMARDKLSMRSFFVTTI